MNRKSRSAEFIGRFWKVKHGAPVPAVTRRKVTDNVVRWVSILQKNHRLLSDLDIEIPQGVVRLAGVRDSTKWAMLCEKLQRKHALALSIERTNAEIESKIREVGPVVGFPWDPGPLGAVAVAYRRVSDDLARRPLTAALPRLHAPIDCTEAAERGSAVHKRSAASEKPTDFGEQLRAALQRAATSKALPDKP